MRPCSRQDATGVLRGRFYIRISGVLTVIVEGPTIASCADCVAGVSAEVAVKINLRTMLEFSRVLTMVVSVKDRQYHYQSMEPCWQASFHSASMAGH
jgi:hypothetical protein